MSIKVPFFGKDKDNRQNRFDRTPPYKIVCLYYMQRFLHFQNVTLDPSKAQVSPSYPKTAPRWPQDGPRLPQGGLKMAKTGFEMASKLRDTAARDIQNGSKEIIAITGAECGNTEAKAAKAKKALGWADLPAELKRRLAALE